MCSLMGKLVHFGSKSIVPLCLSKSTNTTIKNTIFRYSSTTLVKTTPSPNIIDTINNQIKVKETGRLFAVVYIKGAQFKITPEDIIILQGYWAPDIGDRIRIEKVLLAGSKDFTLIGKPLLPRDLIRIEGTVIEKTLSHTQYSFYYAPRQNNKNMQFRKTPLTMVRINTITFEGLVDEVKDIEGLRPAVLW